MTFKGWLELHTSHSYGHDIAIMSECELTIENTSKGKIALYLYQNAMYYIMEF
jgi:hypothetical protein